MSVKERVESIISEVGMVGDLASAGISDSSSLKEELEFSDLDFLDLAVSLEEEFRFPIDDDDAVEKLDSVSSILAYLSDNGISD